MSRLWRDGGLASCGEILAELGRSGSGYVPSAANKARAVNFDRLVAQRDDGIVVVGRFLGGAGQALEEDLKVCGRLATFLLLVLDELEGCADDRMFENLFMHSQLCCVTSDCLPKLADYFAIFAEGIQVFS